MFLNQTISLRRAFPAGAGLGAFLALALALGGCSSTHSWFGNGKATAVEQPQTTQAPSAAEDNGPAEAETVTSNLPDLPPDQDGSTTVVTESVAPINPSAPKSYTVQRGDTLWGLAAKFLKDPWLWPEIWYVNPEVSNPHRIYPGDTLRLAMGSDGKPAAVQVVHNPGSATKLEPLLRSSELDAPIANIPYSVIAAFLSRPGVLTRQQVEAAPYVLALRDQHMIAGTDNSIYVRKLNAAEGERYNILHVGDRLTDPDGGHNLGYLASYAGTAQVTRGGNPASAVITDSAHEIVAGDVLVPETAGAVGDFIPHSPKVPVKAHILAIVNGLHLAGQYMVVALSRGSQQGIEPGHVLRAMDSGEQVRDRCASINAIGTCTAHNVKLPAEPSGTMLVFRVYDRMSYALVLDETRPLSVGDLVTNP
jgi:LysM repeat protein